MELVGFPREGSLCLLLSGGSAATLNALTAARHRAAERAGWNLRVEGLQSGRPPLVLYASAESHSSIQKCAEQLGIGTNNLRSIPADDAFRMRPDALRAAIEDDRKAGKVPFAIVACGGATNTGAIDPLDDVADVAAEFGIWLHVDGAFGAWAALDPAYRDRFKAIARADTVTLNPHKWLQVPVDCGALLTRHPEVHRAAFSLTPDYLEAGHSEAPWPMEHMFQLTYGNRALKVWAALARLGRSGLAELVTRCNRAGDAPGGARARGAGPRAAVAGLAVGRELPLPAGGRQAGRRGARCAQREGSRRRSARAARRTCRPRACAAGRRCAPASCTTRTTRATWTTSSRW